MGRRSDATSAAAGTAEKAINPYRRLVVRGAILAAIAAVVVAAIVFVGPIASRIMTSASLQDLGVAVGDIPGLDEGFVPQGLDFKGNAETGEGFYLMSGYMADGSDSPVYMINADADGKGYGARKITLQNPDGTPCVGHNGGIEMDDRRMFVVNEDGILVFDRAEVDKAFMSGSAVKARSVVKLDFDPAFVEIYDGTLYVGEYYKDPEYPTADTHHILTADGALNRACIYAFGKAGKAGESGKSGKTGKAAATGKTASSAAKASETGYSPTPTAVYSIPDQIQGMCFAGNGNLLLTASWGLDFSSMYEFDLAAAEQKGAYDGDGWKAPLYVLDSRSQVSYVNLPLFAEEAEWVQNRVVVNSEAACGKYIVGKLYGADRFFSYNLNDLKVSMLAR